MFGVGISLAMCRRTIPIQLCSLELKCYDVTFLLLLLSPIPRHLMGVKPGDQSKVVIISCYE